MEWELEWGLVCERGRVRPENQDAVLLWCSPKKGPPLAPELRQAVYRSGCTLVAAVAAGTLDLGTWQSVLFAERDGPRRRSVIVKIMGE